MKKTYLQPMAVVMNIATAPIAVLSNPEIKESIYNDEIDGDKAWSRRRKNRRNAWDDEEEEDIGK
jgi:hypothetical protein